MRLAGGFRRFDVDQLKQRLRCRSDQSRRRPESTLANSASHKHEIILGKSTRFVLELSASANLIHVGELTANWASVRYESLVPKYVIEREIPGVGKLSRDQLQAISQKSCAVLRNLGPQIQWVESYVMDDRIYCVYIAPNEGLIREHARQGGFPANRVSEIRAIIDPTTAESAAH